MPEYPKTLAEFPNCPVCHSTNTISHLATQPAREAGKLAEDAPTQLKLEITPLEQPAIAGVMVPVLQVFKDVCADCGTERCVRAVVAMAPIQFAGPMPPGGNNQGRPPFGGFSPKRQ